MTDKRTADDLDDGTEVDAAPFDDTEEMPYAQLMEMLKGDDDGGDDVAFGKGTDTPGTKAPDQVSVEEGIDLIDGANAKGRKDAKVEAPVEDNAKEPADLATPPQNAKQDDAPTASTPAEALDVDAMLDGLPDDRKDAIRGRLAAADEVTAVFKGYEPLMQQHGAKPVDAVKRLLDLYAYAERNPAEYLAWAASQTGNAQETLAAAAGRLGFKLVADGPQESEDDPFEDPAVKAMRQELAQYKAREREAQIRDIGPDAPTAKAHAELAQLAQSLPHWQEVAPQIAAMAGYQANQGQQTTIEDVKRFYRAALVASGISDAPAQKPTSAAQAAPDVAQQAATKTAADAERLERSRKASMSLDGSGQGAGRRPALDPDASIHSVLSTLMAEQSRG